MREEIFSIIVLFIIIGTPFCGAKECEFKEKSYICENIDHEFPNFFYGNYPLKCQSCQIQVFDRKSFPWENNLNSFNLSFSGLEFIGDNSFLAFKNLQYLLLQNNLIRNVSREAFKGLNQLYELNLQENRINLIESGFLKGLSSNLVNISGNLLEILPENAFIGTQALLILDLSHNNLKKLHKNAFNNLEDLEQLNLSSNKLCFMPLGLFKHLKNLKQLNLSANKFKKFNYGTFTGLHNLIYLNLNKNSLTLFDSSYLLPLRHLNKLDLSSNAIYNLDANDLMLNLPTLRAISLEDNVFSCILLKNVLQFFKSKYVEVISENPRYEFLNINGIACIDDGIMNSISLDYFLEKSLKDAQWLNNNNYCE